MFHNNIAENRSTRVLERPGGRQSINLFGGDETPEPTRTGRRAVQPQQPASATNTAAAGSVRNIPDNHNIFGADTTNIKAASAAAPSADGKPAAGARVTNNIWGSDAEVAKSSTRVLAGPGGGSSGVSGIFGGSDADNGSKSNSRPGSGPNSARSNQTSSQSPFAVDGETTAAVSGKRGNNAAAQRSAGNIISWQ